MDNKPIFFSFILFEKKQVVLIKKMLKFTQPMENEYLYVNI